MSIYFPPLTPEMQAHSQRVTAHVCAQLDQAGGLLSFAQYMQAVLYAPGLGYYSAGSHKLGLGGDFVTAPEISPLFSKCIARQFAEILPNLKQKKILELGAGSGILTTEVLLELERQQILPQAYSILEPSADLRLRQQALLKEHCPHLYSKIAWLDALPESFSGIVFANEVIDAFPVHAFQIQDQAIVERCVGFKDGHFEWVLAAPTTPELSTQVEPLLKTFGLADDYQSELNLLMPPWIKTLGKMLDQGVLLFFDYGYGEREYYHPDRNRGTLRCYYQHRCHDNPFLFPGLQDLTAHVNFTALVANALSADLSLAGYTNQSAFLLASGITDFTNAAPDSMNSYKQNQALKLLMLPSEMGSVIKAVAFTKNWQHPLSGFAAFDKRREL